MFPLVDSLTSKTRRRADSIHSLAAGLGIGVNTLKRLCAMGVFPETLVEKTPGGHWRVRNADIPELRAKLCLWNFSHRKGLRRLKWTTDYSPKGLCCHPRGPDYSPCHWMVKCGPEGFRSKRIDPWWEYDRRIRVRRHRSAQSLTHSHDRQEELEKLHFAIIQMLGSGFIFTVEDSDRWMCEIVEASKKMKNDGHQEAFPPRGQVNPKNLDARGFARALLQVNVAELFQKKGRKTISVKEIAAHMGIGVSTLYRIYGKDLLRVTLRPDVNEHFITTKEERDQAEDAKVSKQFSWRNDGEDGEDFFDKEATNADEIVDALHDKQLDTS
jgi:hypothetical protein